MKLILIFLILASYLLSFALNMEVYKIKTRINGSNTSCLSKENYQDIHREVNHYFRNTILQMKKLPECGSGLWKEVMNLNMANLSHSCPSGWTVSSNPRACSRLSESLCAITRVPVNMNYSRVCGRVVGSGKEATDGFRILHWRGGYVDGVTIFRDSHPREHVWTFASDLIWKCECPTDTTYTGIVGSNYFCDGNENNVWSDSSGCQSNSSNCCGPSRPPWFSTSLSQTSPEDLLVSICCDQPVHDEDVVVKEVLLYVQ